MHVYLDLDGVGPDLSRGVVDLLLHRQHADRAKILAESDARRSWEDLFGMSITDIWAHVDAIGEDWWCDLHEVADRFPHALRFVRLHDIAARLGDVHVLTALPYQTDDPRTPAFAAAGKIRWVRARLGVTFDATITCTAKDKALLARPGDVLVDDTPRNCNAWVKAGGGAVLYTPPTEDTDRAVFKKAILSASRTNTLVRYP